MFVDTSEWLPDVLEEHVEQLTSLWDLRLAVLRSPEWFPADLAKLDRRIEAQQDGLIVAGDRALPLLRKQLTLADRAEIFAAAWPLLSARRADLDAEVLAAMKKAAPPVLAGFVDALCHAAVDGTRPQLLAWLGGKEPALAAAAGEVLAFHGRLPDQGACLAPLLADGKTGDQARGWRAVSFSGSCPWPREAVEPLLDHDDPVLRQEVWSAALWSRQVWLADSCRQRWGESRAGRMECCTTLALVAAPGEQPIIARMLDDQRLGPARLRLAATHGHPGHLPVLIRCAADPDDLIAVTAGQALVRMTGCDVDSEQQVTLAPADGSTPDEFEQEFLDTATRPDPARCQSVLDRHQSQWRDAPRLCRGINVPDEQLPGLRQQVDLESRWDLTQRGAFLGLPGCAAGDLVRLSGRMASVPAPRV
jgi:uncharacterized protein (TIGR02270 family)